MESIEECAKMEIEAFEEKEINAPKVEEIRVLIVSDPNAFKNRSIEECAKREIEAFEKKNLEASKKKDTKTFKDESVRHFVLLRWHSLLIYNHDCIREIMLHIVSSRQDHILDRNALESLINNTYENRVYNSDYIRVPITYENRVPITYENRLHQPDSIPVPITYENRIMALIILIMALFVPIMALFVPMMAFIEQRRQDRVRRRQDRVRDPNAFTNLRRQDRVRQVWRRPAVIY